MTDALADRKGLSEPLRVLLKDYPREAWDDDPAFGEMTRFWLSRHTMFREICARVTTLLEGHLDKQLNPEHTAHALSRYGNALIGGLHQHHTVEDEHYFPQLIPLEPRLAHGFEILDRDHHALTECLESLTDAANAFLRAQDNEKVADKALAEIRRLGGFLDRHLWDEEELVVPIILRHKFDG